MILGRGGQLCMLVKVSNEMDKTFKMKELMIIVFFDIEKAYDSMWREELLIKLNKMGIRGRFYNWVLDFFIRTKI